MRFLTLMATIGLLAAPGVQAQTKGAAPATPKWSLVLHGGAGELARGRTSPAQDAAIRAGMDAALAAGTKVLAANGSALDAVEAAVRVLEDDPVFNAGRGAVFTWEGENELDAAIMDGRTRMAGSVASVTRTRNPISLARAVMEKSPHVFLGGQGADSFSVEQGLTQVDRAYFATPERKKQLERMKARQLSWYDVDLKYGTVGAVAVDTSGHVAAATSTGGRTGKRWGRIGDSPVIGAGTYADDRACAVSATGAGEYFIRVGAAHEICARVRMRGETIKAAGDAVMAELGALGGTGGVILISPDGTADWSYNTAGMSRAKATSGGERKIAVYRDED